MNKLTVTVTQDHINDGQKTSSTRCPIALAIHEQNPKLKLVSVGAWTATMWIDNNKYKIGKLPPLAQDFVGDFDRLGRHNVRPISFEMTLDWNRQF